LVKLFLVEEECVEEFPEEILLSRGLSPPPPFFLLFSAALFFTTALLEDKEKEDVDVSLARTPAGGAAAAVVVVVCDVPLIACVACIEKFDRFFFFK